MCNVDLCGRLAGSRYNGFMTTRTAAPDEITLADLAAFLPEDSFRTQRFAPYTREQHQADHDASPFAEFGPCRCSRFCDPIR